MNYTDQVPLADNIELFENSKYTLIALSHWVLDLFIYTETSIKYANKISSLLI